MMEGRTDLKEKRNGYLWIVFFSVVILLTGITGYKYGENYVKGMPIIITFIFVVYRVLCYTLNSLLLFIFRKKFKINRLKGRVTPIYKVTDYDNFFTISKYSVKYTSLDLEWSIPFSVLFEEQEYLEEGCEIFEWKIVEGEHIEELYERVKSEECIKEYEASTEKERKREVLKNLNKEYYANYK